MNFPILPSSTCNLQPSELPPTLPARFLGHPIPGLIVVVLLPHRTQRQHPISYINVALAINNYLK